MCTVRELDLSFGLLGAHLVSGERSDIIKVSPGKMRDVSPGKTTDTSPVYAVYRVHREASEPTAI